MILAILTLVVVLVGGESTRAEPAAITKAKNEARALQNLIDELEEQLSIAVEDYNYAKAKLQETKTAAANTQAILVKAEAELKRASALMNERVVAIYKQGQPDPLALLVDSASLTDLVNRFEVLERVTAGDVELLAQVELHCNDVAQRKAELAVQLEEEKVLEAQAEAAKVAVDERLGANQKALKGKEAQIAKLVEEERIRQERLAAEAKARAEAEAKAKREAEARAAAAAKANKPKASSGSKKVNITIPDSANAGDVVSIARQYLGCPYVWAGESPSGFDCSGFVMYVYKKVGISLPHSSRMQINYGTRLSKDELKSGDLVFFGNPTISHVGIYIGGGQMIHAAGVGKGVRIDSVWRSNYHGACRIIG
jgi:cell wall-associated NlpC family hydrolase